MTDKVWNSYDDKSRKVDPPCAVYGCGGKFMQFIIVDKDMTNTSKYFRISLCDKHAQAFEHALWELYHPRIM